MNRLSHHNQHIHYPVSETSVDNTDLSRDAFINALARVCGMSPPIYTSPGLTHTEKIAHTIETRRKLATEPSPDKIAEANAFADMTWGILPIIQVERVEITNRIDTPKNPTSEL